MLAALLGFASVPGFARAESRSFEIRDAKTQELYFKAFDTWRKTGSELTRETLYFDLQNHQTNHEWTRYNPQSLLLSAFHFEDSADGNEAHIERKDATLTVSWRQGLKGQTARAALDFRPDMIPSSLVEARIQQGWAQLLAGQPLNIELIVPQRQSTYAFEIVPRARQQIEGEERLLLSAQPRNILLRLLAPRLEFQYSVATGTLRSFTGPSPTRIRGEEQRPLTLVYPRQETAQLQPTEGSKMGSQAHAAD